MGFCELSVQCVVCCSALQHIETWLGSGQDHEREQSVTATAHILAYYLDNLNVKVNRDTNKQVLEICVEMV